MRCFNFCGGISASVAGRRAPQEKNTFDHSSRVEWSNVSPKSILAIRKDTGFCCGSRLRKGEVFAYVGPPQNLKDLISNQ